MVSVNAMSCPPLLGLGTGALPCDCSAGGFGLSLPLSKRTCHDPLAALKSSSWTAQVWMLEAPACKLSVRNPAPQRTA